MVNSTCQCQLIIKAKQKNETLKSTCHVDHSFTSYFKYENNKSLAGQRVQYLTMQPKQTITIQQVLGNTFEMVATHLKYSYNFDKKVEHLLHVRYAFRMAWHNLVKLLHKPLILLVRLILIFWKKTKVKVRYCNIAFNRFFCVMIWLRRFNNSWIVFNF